MSHFNHQAHEFAICHLDHRSATLHCDQFMALLVHQQFAVDAFVALSSQTPDPISTDGTVGSLLRRADGEKLSSQTGIDYTPGSDTEAVMASETCSPAGLQSQSTRATVLCHQFPLIHRSIHRQITEG